MSETKEKFEHWCLVELMGHVRFAGFVTEQVIAGQGLIRIDVPAVNDQQEFTTFKGPSAIYSITPVTKEIAVALATSFRSRPVHEYDLPTLKTPQIGADETDDTPWG